MRRFDELLARLRDPLRWSNVDKCLLLLGAFSFLSINAAVSNTILLESGIIDPYIDRDFSSFALSALDLRAALSVALLLVGFYLRKRNPGSILFVYVTIHYYCFSTAVSSYLIGPFSNAWAILYLLVGGTVGFVLFERRAVISGFALFLTILLGTTIAERMGVIPYAPIFLDSADYGGRPSDGWILVMGGGSLSVAVPGLMMLDYIIRRWREDEQIRERLASIGEMTGRIVHQTRHQLGLIGMSAHQIERHLEGLPEERAGAIRAELAKLEGVREGLAEMLRTDLSVEDAPPVEEQPATYEDLATLEVTRLQIKARRRGVSLSLEEPAPCDAAPRAPGKFAQALFNVIENAVSAARSEVCVSLESGGAQLRLRVLDDGPGIPEEQLPRVLEPFYTTKPDGTGMGLAIARAVVEEEGGSLKLRNRSEGGLEVCFVLPV